MPDVLLRDGATRTGDPRLDRIPHVDPRSLGNYPVAEVLRTVDAPTRSRTWRAGPVLDQGREGACVGFACVAEAAADPGPRPTLGADELAVLSRRVYRRAQALDPWPETQPGGAEGTSVLAGGAAMVEEGYADEYRWAPDVDTVAAALARRPEPGVLVGPCVAGVEWRHGMYEAVPTRGGEYRVEVTGPVVGGHAILIRGVLLRPARYGFVRRAFRWRNSWGAGYGKGGDALIDEDDLAAIAGPSPEFMFPTLRRRPARS